MTIAPIIELYNSAQGRQAPRVRLRVRGLPIKVTQAIPAMGGPVTQWRVNGPGTSASLKAGSMTAQRVRNAAVLAGERQLPQVLRWATSKSGGGILTFAPSLLPDAHAAIEGDLLAGGRFNTHQFLVAQARSQSGNAVGFVGGLFVVAWVGGATAGAPLVLLGLGVGIAPQVASNASGMADQAGKLAQAAMDR